jgi:hypothetical protein
MEVYPEALKSSAISGEDQHEQSDHLHRDATREKHHNPHGTSLRNRCTLALGVPRRRFGHAGQIGREATVQDYVATMVDVFRQARRVLRPDGVLWLNLGDTYNNRGLVGVPWRTALALQADGWHPRQAIVWHKTNAMPESVRNRPTSAHEMMFLLSRRRRYHYDGAAIAEPAAQAGRKPGGLNTRRWTLGAATGRRYARR